MAVQIYYIRPPAVGLMLPEWQDDAACKGLPYELFELQDFEEVERGEQEKSISEGLKICSGCPVRASCKVNSNELDRYWTTRGGQPPEGLFLDSVLPKSDPAKNGLGGGGSRATTIPKAVCKNNHDNWKPRANGRGRVCITCKREADAKRPPRVHRKSRNRHPKQT